MVKDLLFYHHPRDEHIANGKVSWRDFSWQLGKADGELDEDELHPPPTRYCGREAPHGRYPWDNEDGDRDHKRDQARSLIGRVSNWIDVRTKGKEPQLQRGTIGTDTGESSNTRNRELKYHREFSPPQPGTHPPLKIEA
jgi:hypothetical protein